LNNKQTFFIHCGHILGLTAFLYIPIGILLSKGLAPLFATAVVFCLILKIWKKETIPWIPRPVVYTLLTLVCWSFISWFWSITPNETLKTGLSLAVTFLGGAVLFGIGASFGREEKQTFQNGILLGGLLGFSLIAFEFATNAWLTRFLYFQLALIKNPDIPSYSTFILSVNGDSTPAINSGMAATTLFFFPWAIAIKDRYSLKIFIPIIMVGSALILMTHADAVKLSFAVGVLAFIAALTWPRWIPRMICVAITIGVLTAPFIPGLLPNPLVSNKNLEWFSPSSAHRILIWKNTVGHIKQKPLLGSGLDATRGLYSAKDRIKYNFPSSLSNGVAYQVKYEPIPLHSHNAVLQVWLELGAIGALIGIGVLISILHAIDRGLSLRIYRATSIGMFSTALTLACISFGIWQSWWLSAILLSIAYFISVIKRPSKKRNGGKLAKLVEEIGGPKGLEPTRYGDWERKGRAVDF